ncbi:MAG: shikimate dehydrogenase [Spirochaetota bacterium]
MKNTQSINSKTKIFGILGNPLSHTLSPLLHNGLFQEYDYNGLYLVFESPKPDSALAGLISLTNLQACSVTIPHKEWAFRYADVRDTASEFLQTSNTLVWQDGKVHAYNTDGIGAMLAVEDVFPNGVTENVLILGSGGSAKGIAFTLLQKNWPGKIYLAARNQKESEKIVASLNGVQPGKAEYIPLSEIYSYRESIGLVIHTTPVGMKGGPQGSVLQEGFWLEKHVLFDIVYNPMQTEMVAHAQSRGVKIIPGYAMLFYQGIEQFYLFTGIHIDAARMQKARSWLLQELEKKN